MLHTSGLFIQLLFRWAIRCASSCQPLLKLPHSVRGKNRYSDSPKRDVAASP